MRFEDERVEDILRESRALADADRTEENHALLREALLRFPEEVDLCLWAAACFAADDGDLSIELAARAAALAPDDPHVLVRAGGVAQCIDRVDELRDYAAR